MDNQFHEYSRNTVKFRVMRFIEHMSDSEPTLRTASWNITSIAYMASYKSFVLNDDIRKIFSFTFAFEI